MHYITELLHLLPLFIIAIIALFGSLKSIRSNVMIAMVSLIAVIFGSIFHQSHDVFFIDPCIIYMLTLALSVVRLAAKLFVGNKALKQ